MGQLSWDELKKLPYVEVVPTDGRTVEIRSYYDHDEKDWFLYFPVEEGKLGRIAGGEVVSGSYFSAEPVDRSADFHFEVSSVVATHLSYPGASTLSTRLEADLHQMAAVLGKYHLIVGADDLSGAQKRSLLESELEYSIGLCRSFFDLLNRLADRLGRTVRDKDDPTKRSFKDLPDSFAKVALDTKTAITSVRPPEAIAEKWGLFPRLAEFYSDWGPWFCLLRDARDGVFHHGKTVPSVLLLDEGAGLRIDEEPWSGFPVWEETPLVREQFGSVRAFLAHLFDRTIAASVDFMDAFLFHVAVPPAIGPNMNVFVRGGFSSHLIDLTDFLAVPWEGEAVSSSSSASERTNQELSKDG